MTGWYDDADEPAGWQRYDEPPDDEERAWAEEVSTAWAEYVDGLDTEQADADTAVRSLWAEWRTEWRYLWAYPLIEHRYSRQSRSLMISEAEDRVAFQAWAELIKGAGLDFEAIDRALFDPTDDRYPYL